MSGAVCLGVGSETSEPPAAMRCNRERLPSTRTLKRSQIGTSAPFTVAFAEGLDCISTAWAKTGSALPIIRMAIVRNEIAGTDSTRRNVRTSTATTILKDDCRILPSRAEAQWSGIARGSLLLPLAAVQPDEAADEHCRIHDSNHRFDDGQGTRMCCPRHNIAITYRRQGDKAEEGEIRRSKLLARHNRVLERSGHQAVDHHVSDTEGDADEKVGGNCSGQGVAGDARVLHDGPHQHTGNECQKNDAQNFVGHLEQGPVLHDMNQAE